MLVAQGYTQENPSDIPPQETGLPKKIWPAIVSFAGYTNDYLLGTLITDAKHKPGNGGHALKEGIVSPIVNTLQSYTNSEGSGYQNPKETVAYISKKNHEYSEYSPDLFEEIQKQNSPLAEEANNQTAIQNYLEICKSNIFADRYRKLRSIVLPVYIASSGLRYWVASQVSSEAFSDRMKNDKPIGKQARREARAYAIDDITLKNSAVTIDRVFTRINEGLDFEDYKTITWLREVLDTERYFLEEGRKTAAYAAPLISGIELNLKFVEALLNQKQEEYLKSKLSLATQITANPEQAGLIKFVDRVNRIAGGSNLYNGDITDYNSLREYISGFKIDEKQKQKLLNEIPKYFNDSDYNKFLDRELNLGLKADFGYFIDGQTLWIKGGKVENFDPKDFESVLKYLEKTISLKGPYLDPEKKQKETAKLKSELEKYFTADLDRFIQKIELLASDVHKKNLTNLLFKDIRYKGSKTNYYELLRYIGGTFTEEVGFDKNHKSLLVAELNQLFNYDLDQKGNKNFTTPKYKLDPYYELKKPEEEKVTFVNYRKMYYDYVKKTVLSLYDRGDETLNLDFDNHQEILNLVNKAVHIDLKIRNQITTTLNTLHTHGRHPWAKQEEANSDEYLKAVEDLVLQISALLDDSDGPVDQEELTNTYQTAESLLEFGIPKFGEKLTQSQHEKLQKLQSELQKLSNQVTTYNQPVEAMDFGPFVTQAISVNNSISEEEPSNDGTLSQPAQKAKDSMRRYQALVEEGSERTLNYDRRYAKYAYYLNSYKDSEIQKKVSDFIKLLTNDPDLKFYSDQFRELVANLGLFNFGYNINDNNSDRFDYNFDAYRHMLEAVWIKFCYLATEQQNQEFTERINNLKQNSADLLSQNIDRALLLNSDQRQYSTKKELSQAITYLESLQKRVIDSPHPETDSLKSEHLPELSKQIKNLEEFYKYYDFLPNVNSSSKTSAGTTTLENKSLEKSMKYDKNVIARRISDYIDDSGNQEALDNLLQVNGLENTFADGDSNLNIGSDQLKRHIKIGYAWFENFGKFKALNPCFVDVNKVGATIDSLLAGAEPYVEKYRDDYKTGWYLKTSGRDILKNIIEEVLKSPDGQSKTLQKMEEEGSFNPGPDGAKCIKVALGLAIKDFEQNHN